MIDKNPAVGRFAFSKPTWGNFIVEPVPKKIVKVSGQRLVYKEGDRDRFFYDPVLCCDTQAECEAVMSADKELRDRYDEMLALRVVLLDKLFSGEVK